MSGPSPPLGSLAVQAPSLTTKTVHVSTATCHDLSLFKDLLKEYRKLDDTITMRLNRTNAQFRDRDRSRVGGTGGNIEDQACAQIWRELVGGLKQHIMYSFQMHEHGRHHEANWKRRTEIVDYCVGVVDQSMDEKRKSLELQENDPAVQRQIQGALFAEEVKRIQVHNELAVEQIVRRRSLDAFRSRCKYFEVPLTEADARKWWDVARAGR